MIVQFVTRTRLFVAKELVMYVCTSKFTHLKWNQLVSSMNMLPMRINLVQVRIALHKEVSELTSWRPFKSLKSRVVENNEEWQQPDQCIKAQVTQEAGTIWNSCWVIFY